MLAEILGSGPRVVLVHGSVTGVRAWTGQRDLADRFRLELITRPGFPPLPPVDHVDFDEHAELLAEHVAAGEPAHVVGHSYGGVVALLAAAATPVQSLTLIEPPAYGVARGRPEVEELVSRFAGLWQGGPREPRAFLAGFLAGVGAEIELSDPLPGWLEQGARTLMVERPPWEAEIPLERLAGIPTLVVSGGHSPAADAVCDVLERQLGAERAVLPGAGHSAQRAPGFNEALSAFLSRA